jgi:hypothetical protein
MDSFRTLAETLARRTTRRNLFSRGAGVAASALLGVTAGGLAKVRTAVADHTVDHTACAFPGPPCPCAGCQASGVCAKPCAIMTVYYASGCWQGIPYYHDTLGRYPLCCDCDCNGKVPGFPSIEVCGCGDDHHNSPVNCPNGNASGPLK